MTDFRNTPHLPRGLANNNPGNLRRSNNAWLGKVPFNLSTDRDFEQFYNVEDGIRASGENIYNILQNGAGTITDLITTYAPPSDGNDTQAYINSVAQATGLDPNTPVDLSAANLQKIVTAQFDVEDTTGAVLQYLPDSLIQAGLKLMNTSILNDIGNFITSPPGMVTGLALFFCSVML